MSRIDDLLESYEKYIKKHRRFEFIDCAIFTTLGQYEYFDNEVGLYTNPPARDFATDIVYISRDRRAILFVEETLDPSEKKLQLKKYAHLSSKTALLIMKTNAVPAVDVMLVVPDEKRAAALALYEEVVKEEGGLGRNRGISIWSYGKGEKVLKLRGGTLSPEFPRDVKELPSRGVGAIEILKEPHPLYLLQFIIIKALASEYGLALEGIEISKEKLGRLLTPYGIVREGLWREALRIGQDIGLITNFSSDQLTGTLNYTKPFPSSITKLGPKLAYPFAIVEEEDEIDKGQARLASFDAVFEETEDID
jgi:hypothetical protein